MKSKFSIQTRLVCFYFWILINEFINCGYTNLKDPKRNIVFEEALTKTTPTPTKTTATTTTSKQTPYTTKVIPKEQTTDLPAKVESNQTMGSNTSKNSSINESSIITTELPLQLNSTNQYSNIPMEECKLIHGGLYRVLHGLLYKFAALSLSLAWFMA